MYARFFSIQRRDRCIYLPTSLESRFIFEGNEVAGPCFKARLFLELFIQLTFFISPHLFVIGDQVLFLAPRRLLLPFSMRNLATFLRSCLRCCCICGCGPHEIFLFVEDKLATQYVSAQYKERLLCDGMSMRDNEHREIQKSVTWRIFFYLTLLHSHQSRFIRLIADVLGMTMMQMLLRTSHFCLSWWFGGDRLPMSGSKRISLKTYLWTGY